MLYFSIQFILLLVIRYDYALSFEIGGRPADDIYRKSLVESPGTFPRLIGMKTTSTQPDQLFRRAAIVRGTKPRASTRLNAAMGIVGVSPEPIHSAFAFATFLA